MRSVLALTFVILFGVWWPLLHSIHTLNAVVNVGSRHEEETPPKDPALIHRLSKEYKSLEEQDGRSDRFPSVEERIKIYAGAWYTPPCPGNMNATVLYTNTTNEKGISIYYMRELPRHDIPTPRTFVIPNDIRLIRAIVLNRQSLNQCGAANAYCPDPRKNLLPAMERMPLAIQQTPLILHFGDPEVTRGFVTPSMGRTEVGTQLNLPIFKKFRTAYSKEAIEEMNQQTCVSGNRKLAKNILGQNTWHEDIILNLKSERHYGRIRELDPAGTPWEMKTNMTVFRGSLTGVERDGYDDSKRNQMTAKERCMQINRCKMVYTYSKSNIVDARLVGQVEDIIPAKIGDVHIYGDKLGPWEMMTYKAIVMLEGNDVSSGFKWALYSNSVVMTQPPTKTSWAMEELLEPWVHYVPLNEDLSDVEEKMQWVLDHDVEAQEIAQRGSLWMRDLVLHPDAALDDEEIYRGLIKRSAAHFLRWDRLTVGGEEPHPEISS